jgi:hypothetical protein
MSHGGLGSAWVIGRLPGLPYSIFSAVGLGLRPLMSGLLRRPGEQSAPMIIIQKHMLMMLIGLRDRANVIPLTQTQPAKEPPR